MLTAQQILVSTLDYKQLMKKSNAMGTVNGLSFGGRIPPWVEYEDIIGFGKREAGTGGFEAEQENTGVFFVVESIDDLRPFGDGCFTGDFELRCHIFDFFFDDGKHAGELAEDEDAVAFGDNRFEHFFEGVHFG